MALRKFQLLSCDIALGGDILNVVARGQYNPVSYPELLVLRFIHGGEQWVTNVFDVGYVEREDEEERKRLNDVYGAEKIKAVFGNLGAAQSLPNGDNRFGIKPPVVLAPKTVEAAPVFHNPTPTITPSLPAPAPSTAAPGPDSKATTPVIYGGEADDAGYVPVEHEMIVHGEAAAEDAPAATGGTPVAGTDVSPPKASRRPMPVAGS